MLGNLAEIVFRKRKKVFQFQAVFQMLSHVFDPGFKTLHSAMESICECK